MSVDYAVNSGIGFEVVAGERVNVGQSLEEYIYEEVLDGFSYFQEGNAYTGRVDCIFLVIDNPFKYGLDLTKVKGLLEEEVERLGLDIVGTLDVHGGLYIY